MESCSVSSSEQSPSSFPTWPDDSLNPSTITFAQMTDLIDSLRINYFLPFFTRAQHIYPPLLPVELTKLNSIAVAISRYDRTPALDERGQWPFLAIAGPSEARVAEVLLAMGLGERICCGYAQVNSEATYDVSFLSGLQNRLSLG
jgi:hypothetical protein